MSESRRTAVWVTATALACSLISFLLSMHGTAVIGATTGIRGPASYAGGGAVLVGLQFLGAALVFALAFAAMRYWRASVDMWFGALIVSVLLGARFVVDPVSLSVLRARMGADYVEPERIQELLLGFPFANPWAVAVAVAAYPLAVWIACKVGAPRTGDADGVRA